MPNSQHFKKKCCHLIKTAAKGLHFYSLVPDRELSIWQLFQQSLLHDMINFIISDPLLTNIALEVFKTSEAKCDSYGEGVDCYEINQHRFITIDQQKFSPKALVRALGPLQSSKNVYSISTSMIQYFAGGMKDSDAIFHMINYLSKHLVVIGTSPVFRMTKVLDPTTGEDFKHELSFAAVPANFDSTDLSYIKPTGNFTSENSLVKEFNSYVGDKFSNNSLSRIERISLPLVFYLAGLNKNSALSSQILEVTDSSNDFGFDRLAFGELMLRFPSRDPQDEEINFLKNHLGIKSNIPAIWQHNRDQWDKVREEKLSFIGKTMPPPTTDSNNSSYHTYNHLIMSGIDWIIERFGIEIPDLKYIGVPVFARNGITIPLGKDGIVKKFNAATFDKDLCNSIKSHINTIISCDNIEIEKKKAKPAIV